MSLGYSICEEFSDEVYRLHKFNILEPHLSEATEELKCSVEIKHFTVLVERMVQAGYCCTQVQKDHEKIPVPHGLSRCPWTKVYIIMCLKFYPSSC